MEQHPTPPVNEVILSVAFDRRENLLGPQLPAILGHWYEEHPLAELAPRYDMPVERAEIAPPGPSLKLVEPVVQPRYWFRTSDEGEVLQVQNDYLALGWRRRDLGREYVRYATLRERFARLLGDVSTNLGDGIRPRRAEINYTNVIEPNPLWSRFGEVHKLIRVNQPPGDEYEQMSWGYTQALMSGDEFIGRLHVALQPALEAAKREPRLQLMIIARSAEFGTPSIDPALQFLDFAHTRANAAFLGLLTDDARREWGFE